MGDPVEVQLMVGGRSTEHDASLHSYASVRDALRGSTRVDVTGVVFIDRIGGVELHQGMPDPSLLRGTVVDGVRPEDILRHLREAPHIFSLLHGTEGEDGCWQGVAEVFDLRGNFGSVDAAALAMSKVAGAATAAALVCGIRTPDTYVVRTDRPEEDLALAIAGLAGRSCVIKPNSMGASLLTRFIQRPDAGLLRDAATAIAPFDRLALVQEYVMGREITVGVVDRGEEIEVLPPARASFSGPILGHHEKHARDVGVVVDWPDPHSEPGRALMAISRRLFEMMGLTLWGRFDFVVRDDSSEIFFLECNLMPGLGAGSIYPVMLARAGWDLEDLVLFSTRSRSTRSSTSKVLAYEIDPHEVETVS